MLLTTEEREWLTRATWLRCDWHEAQQWRERTLTGSIGLEGPWSDWQDGKPGSISGHRQYEYRRRYVRLRPPAIVDDRPPPYRGLDPANRRLADSRARRGGRPGKLQTADDDRPCTCRQ